MDTLKEAVGSGWANTWEILFGDFEEAKELWTGLSQVIGGFIDAQADARDISSDTEDGALSDAEYMAQLRTKGLKNLADHIVTTAFEGEVEVTRLFKYGEDFFIGDIVQIANEYGNEGSAYISELVISNSEEGLSIYPTFKTISK